MTSNDRATRLLQTWLETEAPDQVPNGLATRIQAATRAERPRPGWLARLEGHHMDVIQGGRRASGVPRLGLILALVGLLAGAFFVYYVGTQPTAPVVNPPSAPPTAAASGAPSAAAVVPTVAPATAAPTAAPSNVQPGDPIPEELLGAWIEDTTPYEEAYPPRFVYVLAPGDPWCVSTWNVQQTCVASIEPDSTVPNDFADVWTIVDGMIRAWPMGSDCAGEPSTMKYTIDGDRVTFQLQVGSCYGTVFPMIRIGSEGAPASAPPLPGS